MSPPKPKTITKSAAIRAHSLHPLHARRLERHLSLEDVAADCGTFRSTVSRWENGKADPIPGVRKKLAASMNWTLAELGAHIYAGRA